MNNDNHHQAAWSDFNDADAQQGEFNLIPKGTQALVRMAIKPGGHDDASKGWTGGYATASDETGAVFLSCEFVLLTGPFAKRKIWSNVGLHSNKGPTWAQMGRSFIKAVLNSSRNIHPDDNSPEAQRARQIRSFGDLDGAEFAARIGIEKDGQGEYRNIIRLVIEPAGQGHAVAQRGQQLQDQAPQRVGECRHGLDGHAVLGCQCQPRSRARSVPGSALLAWSGSGQQDGHCSARHGVRAP
jgi:hypothetical protein